MFSHCVCYLIQKNAHIKHMGIQWYLILQSDHDYQEAVPCLLDERQSASSVFQLFSFVLHQHPCPWSGEKRKSCQPVYTVKALYTKRKGARAAQWWPHLANEWSIYARVILCSRYSFLVSHIFLLCLTVIMSPCQNYHSAFH